MLLPRDEAFALTVVREAEHIDACPGPRAIGGDAAERAGVQALIRDARTRIETTPGLQRIWRTRRWLDGRRPGIWLLPIAALMGLLFTGLAADGRLDILTPPLLGLILWQIVVLLYLLARRWLEPAASPGVLRTALINGARRIARWGMTRPASSEDDSRDGSGVRLAVRVGRAWSAQAAPQIENAIAATLHGSGAAFAIGAIAGLYLDGLGVAYRATWESTFLDASTVQLLLQSLLGAAAALTGIALPDAAGVAAMASAPVPAAPWIHLWAVTLLLFAVLPRLLLTLLCLRSALRPIDVDEAEPWLQRSIATLSGTALMLRVQPLGYRPAARSWERLQDLVQQDWGPRARIERNAPLPWDASAGAVVSTDAVALLLMVNPAQTPEDDVHGPLLDALQSRVPVTVVLDASAYNTSATRRSSRIGTWQRMLQLRETPNLVLEAESDVQVGVQGSSASEAGIRGTA